MALVLGVQPNDIVLVGLRKIRVATTEDPTQMILVRDDGKVFTVKHELMTEVFPNVLVSIGSRRGDGHRRLIFKAPRTILITRARPQLKITRARRRPKIRGARGPSKHHAAAALPSKAHSILSMETK